MYLVGPSAHLPVACSSNAIVIAEELVCFTAHLRKVAGREPGEASPQLDRRYERVNWWWTQLSDLDATPGDAEGLPALHLVHHRGVLVPQFALAYPSHTTSVAHRSTRCYR